MTRQVLFVAYTPAAQLYLDKLRPICAAAGVTVTAVTAETDDAGVSDAQSKLAAAAEAVVVLGGDGSFLRGAELAHPHGLPVVGINLGRIGFLAEAEADEGQDALRAVLDRNFRTEERMTIDVQIVAADGTVLTRGWALNEASIENRARRGLLEIIVEVDDRPVSAFACDGMLVATPTGSTAYAFSAGGPVMWPETQAILLCPSNAHALFARPMVTSPDSVVAVEINGTGHDAIAFLDGRRVLEVPAGARIEVRRGATPINFIRLDAKPFADRLVRKFQLPVTGWRGRPPAGE